MDKHLEILCKQHLETKFAKVGRSMHAAARMEHDAHRCLP